MKFTIERTAALAAVTSVKAVIERRNTTPILSNIMIEADADSVRFVGTDMDIRRVHRAPATVATPGETTVPVEILANLLKELPAGALVECETETEPREGLRVRCGRLSALLHTLPAADFPSLGDLPKIRQTLEIPADKLADAMARVSFAISTEDTRYYLNGIAFECRAGNMVRLIATDGNRMAAMDIPGIRCRESEDLMILPRKGCEVLLKSIAKAGADPVTIAIHGADPKQATRFVIRHGDVTTNVKLIDGVFPDYTRVIPSSDADGVFEYAADEMAAVVKRLTAISSERCRSVKLALNGAAVLSVCDYEGGDVSEMIDAGLTGKGVEIGFNGSYLIEAGAAFGKTAAVRMAYWDNASPVRMTAAEVAGLVVVQMPMRV